MVAIAMQGFDYEGLRKVHCFNLIENVPVVGGCGFVVAFDDGLIVAHDGLGNPAA